MGNSTTVHKGTIYVACAEKLSGSDILYISFDRQDALDAARSSRRCWRGTPKTGNSKSISRDVEIRKITEKKMCRHVR